MKPNNDRKQTENASNWERTATRASTEVLAILSPTADEPNAIQRTGIWKTGPTNEPIGSAA